MIPREISKQIRTTGLRTNGLAQDWSSVFQLFRLTAGVKDRQNHDPFGFNQKMDYKRETTKNHCPSDFTANLGKSFRIVYDALQGLFNDGAKFPAQSLTFVFVVSNGIIKFLRRHPAENQTTLHLRYFALSRALTSSSETTSSGWLRWSCRRRSMSSASPGVSSFDSTMPSQRVRHNSICSASGSARASFKTKSELISLNLTGLEHFASA
jgi:hypothetical protein